MIHEVGMIREFKGEHAWLSNFYRSKQTVGGVTYDTNEHFYQTQKTLIEAERQAIIAAPTPGQAKKLGRKVTLRDDWFVVREAVMWVGLMEKYKANPDLITKLVATYPHMLVEGNYWNDKYWGVCLKTNTGNNVLGTFHMRIRDIYMASFN